MQKDVKRVLYIVVVLLVLIGLWSMFFGIEETEDIDGIENGSSVVSPEESIWEIEDSGVLFIVDDVYWENSNLVFETILEDLDKRKIYSEYRILGPWKLIDAEGNEYWSSLTEVKNVTDEQGEMIPHKLMLTATYRGFEGRDTGLSLLTSLQPGYMQPREDGTITMMDVYFDDLPLQTEALHSRSINDFSLEVETEKDDSSLVLKTRIEGSSELLDSVIEQIGLEIKDDLGNVYTSNETFSKKPSDEVIVKRYHFSEISEDAEAISFFYVMKARISRPEPIQFLFTNIGVK